MRRILFASLVVLGCWPAASAQAQQKPAAGGAAPRIAVEPAGFDFGDALPNKTLHKEFAIRNFGGAELVIEGISTTCGCTAAALETKTLKPGASVPLRVTLETRSYSGPIERSVLIRSNDPEKGRLELKLKANVQAAPPAK